MRKFMPARSNRWLAAFRGLFLISAAVVVAAPAVADEFVANAREIADMKAVFGTVQAADVIAARARISGTVASLSVDEGSAVAGGAVLAVVGDPKLALRIEALEAEIEALKSEVENARTERDRAATLYSRGTIAKARLDQTETALEVTQNKMKAAEAQRSVVVQQMSEGEVLAPSAGRVLSVPVTAGSVVMPGETIATIATDRYIVRLELPERHARFIAIGDRILVGRRGLDKGEGARSEGKLTKVYPELSGGRVIADAVVEDLGDYFVGERALVWIAADKRSAIAIPSDYAFKRHGLDYVRIARESGKPVDVVVQLGQMTELDGTPAIEVLSGVFAGDRLVKP
ncbi:MAG: efflux RND transporter periplasmic adaptor subunit [Hyphomicrobiales bacterium]|nr:efflux RND transporter periplasmic adaptor subunit [Hyphomicrobiales bacterium]